MVLAAGHPRPARILPLARPEPTPAAARLRATAAAGAAMPARTSGHSSAAAGICTSPSAAGRALAAWMSRGILAAVREAPEVGLAVSDTRTGVSCELHPGWHFDSASIVKVIILAGMTHTTLGPGILWGLTQATAPDELRLLTVLTSANPVLDQPSREYELQLMAQVIPAQCWGVPAGAEPGVTVHVKNGWLPDPRLWVVNSIGAFTSDDGVYKIVVLSQDNPAMSDGIALVQGIATVVNRALAPG